MHEISRAPAPALARAHGLFPLTSSVAACCCVCPADVLTIENSRSGDAMVSALAAAGYSKDLGPGVYDVHSPQVGVGVRVLVTVH